MKNRNRCTNTMSEPKPLRCHCPIELAVAENALLAPSDVCLEEPGIRLRGNKNIANRVSNITNDEKQKENCAARQFFSSLLV
jgi:hypothetical protein